MADPAHETLRCPECHTRMTVGHVAVSQGLLWMRRAEGPYGDFAEAIPGTHAVLRANRLPAWKCSGCQLLLFRFGHDLQRQQAIQRDGVSAPNSTEASAEAPPQ